MLSSYGFCRDLPLAGWWGPRSSRAGRLGGFRQARSWVTRRTAGCGSHRATVSWACCPPSLQCEGGDGCGLAGLGQTGSAGGAGSCGGPTACLLLGQRPETRTGRGGTQLSF